MNEKTIIAAHQPNFLPYLGLFYKIYKSDRFIFVDDVQFSTQNGFSHHKNYIKTPQGKMLVRIPVKKSSKSLINEAMIDYSQNWIEKMKRTMFLNYGKAARYEEVNSWLFDIIERKYERLSDLNIALIVDISKKLGLGNDFDVSSKYVIKGKKEELVVNLIEFFGGDAYYSGTGAADYLHEAAFEVRGMELIYSDYKSVQYKQLWGDFVDNLSIIDYLYNCGFVNPFIEGE